MPRLSSDSSYIKNGTLLLLKNGETVICVNDRGYQISVTDPTNKRAINFIKPSDVAQILGPKKVANKQILAQENNNDNNSSNATQSKFPDSSNSPGNISDLLAKEGPAE